ncbi:M42 family metallopeptidase [candidate division WOR-3 bacterium]|nr:M42 family metallopeptidase [candidate division WOR-3 bacterium]
MKSIIKKLTETFGPSGFEKSVRNVIRKEIRDHVDSIKSDKLGNLIAHIKGKGTKVMLASHMDEIGVVTSYIDKNGFIRFSNVGGFFPVHSLTSRIIFENGRIGVIGEERRKSMSDPVEMTKLYIDIGARDRKAAEKLVPIGTFGCYERGFEDIGKRIVAKALDDRIGCAVLIEVAKRLKRKVKNDTYLVFTVQEEVGLKGARTSAFGIDPDIALAVDVTATGDTPEAKKMAVKLGAGAAIKIKDWGIVCDPKIVETLIRIARRNKIPYQFEILERGTTDATVIQLTKGGIPSAAVSIPSRYIHSASEIVDMDDVEAAVKLIVKFLKTDQGGLKK